jgi:hypothetical protein
MLSEERNRIIAERANYEDWNILSMERRASMGINTETRAEVQLKWLLEDESEEIIEH